MDDIIRPRDYDKAMPLSSRRQKLTEFHGTGKITSFITDQIDHMPCFSFFWDKKKNKPNLPQEAVLDFINKIVQGNHITQLTQPFASFEKMTEQEGFLIASTIAIKPDRYIDRQAKVLKPIEAVPSIAEIHARKHIDQALPSSVEPFKKPFKINGKINFPELKTKAELGKE